MVAVAIVISSAKPDIYLALPAAIIIGREITVSALREWMAEIGARNKVAVSCLGKDKNNSANARTWVSYLQNAVFGMPVYEIGLGSTLYCGNFNSDIDGSVFMARLATIKRINW